MGEGVKIPRNMAEILGGIWRFVYWLPAQLLHEEHWTLTPEEAQLLGEGTDECLKTLPRSKRAVVAKFLASYAPWAMLAGTAYTMTAIRMNISALNAAGGGTHVAPAGNGAGSSAPVYRSPRGATYAKTRHIYSWADYRPTGRSESEEGS